MSPDVLDRLSLWQAHQAFEGWNAQFSDGDTLSDAEFSELADLVTRAEP